MKLDIGRFGDLHNGMLKCVPSPPTLWSDIADECYNIGASNNNETEKLFEDIACLSADWLAGQLKLFEIKMRMDERQPESRGKRDRLPSEVPAATTLIILPMCNAGINLLGRTLVSAPRIPGSPLNDCLIICIKRAIKSSSFARTYTYTPGLA